MWRLLSFILICALFLAFVTLNLENKSDISFGFHTFYEIPVFLTAFSAFVLGMLFATPLALFLGRRRKKYSPAPYAGGGEAHAGSSKASSKK